MVLTRRFTGDRQKFRVSTWLLSVEVTNLIQIPEPSSAWLSYNVSRPKNPTAIAVSTIACIFDWLMVSTAESAVPELNSDWYTRVFPDDKITNPWFHPQGASEPEVATRLTIVCEPAVDGLRNRRKMTNAKEDPMPERRDDPERRKWPGRGFCTFLSVVRIFSPVYVSISDP